MEAHHASLGRRKLEEIRQKKALEKNQAKQTDLIQSGSDQDFVEILRLELGAAQKEGESLRRQLDEKIEQLQVLTRDLQDSHSRANNDARLISELKQSLRNLTVERDAAITSKEDVLAQLRITRKRLQEAEDEQYKAEEDAAVLRAELKNLQHMEQSGSSQSLTQFPDHYGISEQELKAVKEELHDTVVQLQNERRQLVLEQLKVAQLVAEKNELERAVASSQAEVKKALATVPNATAEQQARTKVDRGKYEQHLRELASMVERLENGRQKLLAEIDRQSMEIEKLFMENAGLISGINETTEIATRWEHKFRECNQHKAELLKKSQVDQAYNSDAISEQDSSDASKLKMELTKALEEKDQLALELASVRITLNGFNRLYNPVLSSLETRLLQIKQNPVQQIDISF